MTSNDILDFLRALIALPASAFWPSVAWLLDAMRQIGGVTAGVIAVGLLALPVVFAFTLQRRLNRLLEREPQRRLGLLEYLKMEFWCSVLALPAWPVRLLVALGRGIGRLVRVVLGFFQGRRRNKPAPQPSPAAAQTPPAAPQPPLLVASLGPGFLLAGVTTVALYLVAKLLAPLLRAELGLSPGLSVWQYVFLGRRPELAWYLPLDRFPFLGGLLSLLLWILVWSVIGIILRCFWRGQVGRNLAADRDDRSVLPFWRQWFGAPALWEPALSYREWAYWPVGVAVPFLGWAWFSVAGDPYRIPFSDFAVGALLWTSWGLHLALRGRERTVEKPAEEPAAGTEANGWPQVLERLHAERQIAAPEPFEERAAEPLPFSEVDPRTAGFLSPLVSNHLLPKPHKLTSMQRVVLTQLALQGYVHVDPPVALDRLSLGEDVLDVLQDRSGQRCRHQIVLAPEGSGKTALALLAAANHALVHTRSTLVVVRDEKSAEQLAERFRKALEPSPLRWNVRVRHPGADLMNDLSQGICPDVVLCGLRDLVVTLLDRPDTFAPFLRNLGLIVVDDVESFAGPVEVHAQLAFRRLTLRVGELMGIDELGDKKEESAPQILVLGAESMHEMPKWARSLCGIDAVVRRFSRSTREQGEQEAAAMAASGIAEKEKEEGQAQALKAEGGVAVHRFYRLRDFRTAAGEGLSVEEIIAACERLAVPWHYRLCGDGRRELGRGPLLLRDEPLHFAPSPEEACVVLLEGTWSEVRRERQRLTRAGARFSRFRQPGGEMVIRPGAPPEMIAFVTIVDADLEMALTQLDKSFGLAPALDSLPRPVLRPPTGLAVGPHLSADLTRHWIEVADLLTAFGASTAATLRWLADGGMLLCEPRIDVEERSNEYAEKVYVRALARAVRSPGEEDGPFAQVGRELLPPKVTQVEVAPRSLIAVRDRTDLVLLGQADDANAHFLFYPGRIFKDARGTFVVVGRAGDEIGGAAASPQPAQEEAPDEAGHGDVLVEPLLADEISSPRRRFVVRSLREDPAMAALLEAAGGSFPDPNLVLIGRYPFAMALEPVEVQVEHVATYRLGPVQGEIRQRTLLDKETRQRYFGRRLPTVALALFPNPGGRDEETPDAAEPSQEGSRQEPSPPEPRLTIEQARVLAAALRALLPAMYRGGGDGLVVALHLDEKAGWDAGRPLGPGEGLYLFDADFGGNGTARAVYRDGVDLLLRLARLAIERILSLTRLRALHDEWGDEAEILAETRGEASPGSTPETPAGMAAPDEAVRHGLLQWLDSRLQPEGGVEMGAGGAGAREGSEQGEGDRFDLGRCWFSRDDAFSDLVWVKHRWRLPVRGEAMLDIAFDRKTETDARAAAQSPVALGAYHEQYAALLASPAAHLSDGSSRHAPRGARFLVPEQREPHTAGELETDRLRELHAQAVALTQAASPVLKPLAGVLLEHAGGMALPGNLRTVQALAAFVQGIPFSVARAVRSEIRPPVSTLLYRLGDGRAKGLLLAVLLRRVGIDAGLFHSLVEERTFAAVALPDRVPEGGDVPRHLESWSRAAGLPAAPSLWAELPGRSGEGTQIFVPVPVRTYADAWIVQVGRPDAWAFLPLLLPEPPLDAEADAEAGPAPSEEAEHESRS